MNTPVEALMIGESAAQPLSMVTWRRRGIGWRFLETLWKLLFGAFCGMSAVLSILIVGWAQRAAHREVVRSWWKRCPNRRPRESFAQFAEASGRTFELAAWPNWFTGNPGPGVSGWRDRLWQRAFGGLLANVRLGIQSAFNVAVFTLPGGLLWTFGWYAGWMNSFHKGYENYFVGISVFAAGIVLFIASMLYVPMALARHASTGNWRSFYDFKLIWTLIQRRWMGQFVLAVIALGLAFILSIFRAVPQFLPQMNALLANATALEQLRWIESYFLGTALFGFTAFVLFRLVAARVYAGALLDAVQRGVIVQEQLADREWEILNQLGLIHLRPLPSQHVFFRFARWLGTRAGRIVGGFTTSVVWFFFVFNVMTVEFLNYHQAGRGWWNQPIIQLPWFDYTPDRLRVEAARETQGERDYEQSGVAPSTSHERVGKNTSLNTSSSAVLPK